MIVKINDNEVTVQQNDEFQKPSFGRNAKEEREAGNIVIISGRPSRYETYDKVDITSPNEQYLVQADEVVELNGEWQHTLTLIENIAYFDTIYPADRSFRKLNQTLGDILLVYKRELSTFHGVDIDYTELDTATLNEIIPFKEFAGLNFSQILQSLFRKIWAIPKVNRDGTIWDIYPQYHSTKNTAFTSITKSNIYKQNNVDYATRVKSQLKNAVNENGAKWFPSETGYVLPRSSNFELAPSKLRYELDSPIVSIIKAEVVGIDYNMTNDDTSTVESFTNQTIDISGQIVQQDVYDLLPTLNDFTSGNLETVDNNRNALIYNIGEKYITNLYESNTDNFLFTGETKYIFNAIKRAAYVYRNSVGNYSNVAIVTPTNTASNVQNIKMRFKYIKQRNMDVVHSRKTKGVMNEATAIHTQRDSSIEAGQYLRNLKFYSNRMGNNTYSKSKIVDIGNEYEVFDYSQDGIVVDVKNTYLNSTQVLCEWEEAENFANIQAEYALMKRSEPYPIIGKSVTTNLIWEEYLQFSLTQISSDAGTKLTSDAKRLALAQFESATNSLEPVSVGVFKPDLTSWNSDYAIHMPVEVAGDGNNISMHVFFEHQNIAAKTYYDLDNDTLQDYLNPLPYTDEDGRLEDFYLYFTPSIEFEDDGEYPLILDETSYVANKYTDSVLEPLDLDGNAAFAYTFALSFISDDEIYIGDKVAKDNYLFNSQSGSGIEIYTSTKPYGEYDQAPRSYDTDATSDVTYSYNSSTHIIQITPTTGNILYFSIVKDDEILLAVNKAVLNGNTLNIYVNHFSEFDVMFLEATASGLSSLVGEANLVYTSRIYDLNASASALTSLVGNANLEYTALIYDLSASASDLASLVGEANLVYTEQTLTLNATASNLSAISGEASLEYTVRQYALEATASNLSAISGEASLEYTEVSMDLSATASSLAGLSGEAGLDVPAQVVDWQPVSSGTITGGTCIYEYDEDNIKSELENECQFTEDGALYDSKTDQSTSIPACSEGATYTVCFLNPAPDNLPLDTYECQDYVGEIVQVTQLYECQRTD